jgi:hypothetical protein
VLTGGIRDREVRALSILRSHLPLAKMEATTRHLFPTVLDHRRTGLWGQQEPGDAGSKYRSRVSKWPECEPVPPLFENLDVEPRSRSEYEAVGQRAHSKHDISILTACIRRYPNADQLYHEEKKSTFRQSTFLPSHPLTSSSVFSRGGRLLGQRCDDYLSSILAIYSEPRFAIARLL